MPQELYSVADARKQCWDALKAECNCPLWYAMQDPLLGSHCLHIGTACRVQRVWQLVDSDAGRAMRSDGFFAKPHLFGGCGHVFC
jgi:hypothetical protein